MASRARITGYVDETDRARKIRARKLVTSSWKSGARSLRVTAKLSTPGDKEKEDGLQIQNRRLRGTGYQKVNRLMIVLWPGQPVQ